VVLDPNGEYSTIGNSTSREKNSSFNFQASILRANENVSEDAVAKKIRAGQVAVFAADDLSFDEKRSCYTNILNLLVKSRRAKTIPPFLLVVEDAENLPLPAIQEAMGSKNGIAIIVVSSHPAALGGKVLTNVGNQMVGRIMEPEDLAFLKNIVEGSDEQLQALRVGEWVINGINVARPIKVHVR